MNIEKYLSPIPGDDPAGADLSASGAIYELDRLIAGKPETQFAPAEEADWRAVREKCEELLAQSKDLRVAAAYANVLLRLKGWEGFAAGLLLIRNYLETAWEGIYPRLDPDDNNDPQERVNALNVLGAPVGTAGDPYKTIAVLRTTPITQSVQAGNWGLDAILAARDNVPMLDGNPAPSTAIIDGAFSESPPDFVSATLENITTALDCAQAINNYFTDTLSASAWPNYEILIADLQRIKNTIDAHQSGAGASADSDDSAAAPASAGGAAPARASAPGGISSREDVVRTLDLIIRYYAQNEPASPIPLMLERVKRLVPMSFMEIIKDMTPDAMDRVTLITGAKPPEEEY
ncbi:type VI secretion system protein ImpA [Ereboglobus sp. PH5-5]|uniref:type VI secretion system protein TssA n=1 Tax=Ereboglobus sp. PH5-5 TaxID=2940529 RepID=UPI002404C875|nr:type VI secretion system protein TssA [Ereboglobus sp. PH5-5]MDF9832738.1 type VI secretion system protein ImpA [Ereboglobus sp. PH5-5]